MLNEIRSRLSYANAMATTAVFIALGGGTYALSGVPDNGGVVRGCVSNRTGLLRVVNGTSGCRKPTGRGPRRDPGELAVSLSTGATVFSTKLPADSASHTLKTVGGLKLSGSCDLYSNGDVKVEVKLDAVPRTRNNLVQYSGTGGTFTSGRVFDLSSQPYSTGIGVGPDTTATIDVIARNTAVGNFMRIDLHGQHFSSDVNNRSCDFWGMITPTS
jgi:hypothetical protein